MVKVFLKLQTLEQVYEFVRLTSRYPGTIDISSGRHRVDGKSILGVLSLNCANGINVIVYGTDEEKEAFKEALKVFE